MRLRIIDTLLFNIRAFGLRKGLRLPVYIYGKVKVYQMGKIEICCPIKRAIVIIGMNAHDTSAPYTIFNNKGVIEIHGRTYFHHGCRLTNQGKMVLGANNIFSHNTQFDIKERIDFGHDVSVGYDSVFTDSDVHYSIDVQKRRVYRNTKPIRIGNYNWFGSSTHIKKGTITPDYTMVASPNALLSKDYTDIPPYTILAGSPARPIKQGLRRVYKFRSENMIRQYFAANPDAEYYQIDNDVDLDDFCKLYNIE